MSARSIGELLLRRTLLSSRISFAQNSTASIRRTAPSWTERRLVSTSPTAQAAQPQRKDDPYDDPFELPKPQNRISAEESGQSIDSLFASMSQPAFNRRPPDDQQQRKRVSNVFGSDFSDARPGQRPARGLDFGAMDMGDLPQLLPSEQNALTPTDPEKQIYPRLNPAFGRTVELNPARGRDLVRGLAMMGTLTGRNKVRADFNKQKFHERNGLKRKRLKSERWRARFKQGFQKVTARVTELTRKGW